MSNRQVYQLNTRTLALTDVVPTQDNGGIDELGINTIQDIGNAVSSSIVTAAVNAVVASNNFITTGSAGASQSITGSLTYSGTLIGGNLGSASPSSLTIHSDNSDYNNIQGTGSYITLVNTNRISGQTTLASVFRTTSGGDYKTKGKLRFDFAGNMTYIAYENASNTLTGSHVFYVGGDFQTGSVIINAGNSVIDMKRGLTVSGSTNLSGSLTTIGATSIGSTLSVTGASTFGNGLTVTGSTVLSGSSISITGNTNITGSLSTRGIANTTAEITSNQNIRAITNTDISLIANNTSNFTYALVGTDAAEGSGYLGLGNINGFNGYIYAKNLTENASYQLSSTAKGTLLATTGSNIISGSLTVTGSTTITDVLVLPFQNPLPSSKPTASIALSGSGGTFVGMYVYNGTAWTKVGP